MFKGTKGKWAYEKMFDAPIFCEANDSFQNSYDILVNHRILYSGGYQSNKSLCIGANNEIEAEANALLISKAPEMLDTLIQALDWVLKKQGKCTMFYKIQDLIKSATDLESEATNV